MKIIIKESQYVHLLENLEKKKRFFTKLLGEDLIDSIQEITSAKQLPIEFLKSIGTSVIQQYIDTYGPLYYFVLDGEPFIYKDRVTPKGEEYEVYMNNKGKSFLDGEITERLGLSDMGLKFSDVIDTIFNEGDDDVITEDQLNLIKEETDESTKEIKFLKKYYDVEVSSDKIGKKIHTLIKFIPKDSEDEMTPSVVSSWGLWTDKGNGRLDFEDCTYVRNNRMPLLNYVSMDYALDNYTDRLHRQEAKKRIS